MNISKNISYCWSSLLQGCDGVQQQEQYIYTKFNQILILLPPSYVVAVLKAIFYVYVFSQPYKYIRNIFIILSAALNYPGLD